MAFGITVTLNQSQFCRFFSSSADSHSLVMCGSYFQETHKYNILMFNATILIYKDLPTPSLGYRFLLSGSVLPEFVVNEDPKCCLIMLPYERELYCHVLDKTCQFTGKFWLEKFSEKLLLTDGVQKNIKQEIFFSPRMPGSMFPQNYCAQFPCKDRHRIHSQEDEGL